LVLVLDLTYPFKYLSIVRRSTVKSRASLLLFTLILQLSISKFNFGKSSSVLISITVLISICICIIFTSEILCNTNHILYILIQSFLYIVRVSFIIYDKYSCYNLEQDRIVQGYFVWEIIKEGQGIMGKQLFKKFFAILAALLLVVSSFPQLSSASEKDEEKTLVDVVNQGIYDPNNDYLHLDVRFWEDEKPEVGFYINHANLYNYNVVDAPIFGTSNGEWTVMGLLRGLDGGYYYNDELTQEYFDGYINRVEEYV